MQIMVPVQCLEILAGAVYGQFLRVFVYFIALCTFNARPGNPLQPGQGSDKRLGPGAPFQYQHSLFSLQRRY